MSIDINEKVLAAFQVEHKEQLEGIRVMLAKLEGNEGNERQQYIDEAFRLAHSLKGGARVCDLRPAETLAHGLESVFEQVRSGQLGLDNNVVTTIDVVLDAIEDWMAAIERDKDPIESREALCAIERLLEGEGKGDRVEKETDDGARRLIEAFLAECPRYLAELRQFGSTFDDDGEPAPDRLSEAFRLAHNLRGSADAADVESVAKEGKKLESLIADLCDGTLTADSQTRQRLDQHVDTIDHELTQLVHCPVANGSPEIPEQECRNTKSEADPDESARVVGSMLAQSAVGRNSDTVRVTTESLDRLLGTSRQLVAECLHQQQMSGMLDSARQLVDQMQQEREAIRRITAGSIHKLTTLPEFRGLVAHFEALDRNVQSLTRQTRSLCSIQKRNAWRLQSRGRQIEQDVRQARMVPAEVVYQGLRKLVRDLAKAEGKQVVFRVSGFDVRADRMVFQALKDPLIHMLRNCVVHGIESPAQRSKAGKSETCRVELRIETIGNQLIIEVGDDGRGIDRAKIASRAIDHGLIAKDNTAKSTGRDIVNFIFQPGFSTSDQVSEVAGRGMGLSVVKDTVARLNGDVQVCQTEATGAKFRITIPICVSSHRLLLVSAAEQTYAIPLHGIARLLRIKVAALESIEGKPVVSFQNCPIPLVSLASVLGHPNAALKSHGDSLLVAVLKSGSRHLAVSVDALLAERDLLIQDLDGAAMNNQYLGAILLEDTSVALVLNPAELLIHARHTTEEIIVEQATIPTERRKRHVLVVDDSLTTRTLEKSILEANGYDVSIAVDGLEGLNRLRSEHFDLVISDVEMPRMNGFSLLKEIKEDDRLTSTPVILVTSRARREDQAKGLDLGAEAYIVKKKFDHQSLLNTIQQVVGE